MRKMKNIEIDLLLRVDFFALTKYGDREDYSIKQFTIDKEEIKIKYQILKYYTRQKDGYEYIRLTDVDNNIESYRRYLEDLKSINKFWCCHLEQAIGLFQNKELKIFFQQILVYVMIPKAIYQQLKKCIVLNRLKIG